MKAARRKPQKPRAPKAPKGEALPGLEGKTGASFIDEELAKLDASGAAAAPPPASPLEELGFQSRAELAGAIQAIFASAGNVSDAAITERLDSLKSENLYKIPDFEARLYARVLEKKLAGADDAFLDKYGWYVLAAGLGGRLAFALFLRWRARKVKAPKAKPEAKGEAA